MPKLLSTLRLLGRHTVMKSALVRTTEKRRQPSRGVLKLEVVHEGLLEGLKELRGKTRVGWMLEVGHQPGLILEFENGRV